MANDFKDPSKDPAKTSAENPAENPAGDTAASVDESELVEVLASIDPMQMRMARDLLEGSGIPCFVFDRENSRMFGSSAAFPIRLMVHRDVAEDAVARLKELGFPE